MARIFPTDASVNALTYIDSSDTVVVFDASESSEAKTVSAALIPVPLQSDASGKNIATGTDYNSIATDVHSASIYGGGTIGSPNVIGSATHDGSHADGDYPAAVLPNHATIIGSYDQLNNQQATTLFCPHSFAPAAGGGSGHNAAVGGSWSKIDGTYNCIIGGGGSNALKNEITQDATRSVILGGDQHTLAGDDAVIIGSRDADIATAANGSVICGGNVTGHNIDSAGAVILGGATSAHSITSTSAASVIAGGRGNTADLKAYQLVIGQDGLGHIRAGFTQSTDNIRANGDAQAVRWVGKGSGTGTVPAYPSSAGDCAFGDYGTTGGMWAGTVDVIIRNTVSGDWGHWTGVVQVEWTAGGSSTVTGQTWTENLNEPSPGFTAPSMGTGSNGRIFARGVGLLVDTHDVIAKYDGVMTHY